MNNNCFLVDNKITKGDSKMKSICIKTNDLDKINYLLNLLENTQQENICFSCNSFKHYDNIIIHYTGIDLESFISTTSELLSCLVIDFYEERLIKRLIFLNYFYFDIHERNTVFKICLENLSENSIYHFNDRYKLLLDCFNSYLLEKKQLNLEGFVNFRLKKYIKYLSELIDEAVNQYIVEREYWEFISLLKVYVSSEISSVKVVHLVYNNNQSFLLDEKQNVIDIKKNMFKARYLSDISFSSNDYALNTLLDILPQKIYVHLADKNINEFINTLLLIFENRVEICKRL